MDDSMLKPLFCYTDYRAYLSDMLKERKAAGLPASNRWFAQRMGINSSSWLSQVIQGTRHLKVEGAGRLSEILHHSPVEKRYFQLLVDFNQADTIVERNRYFAELEGLRSRSGVRTLGGQHYEYYSTWYHSVVRSLVGLTPVRENYDELAGMVQPPITPSQARKSIELLMRLGLASRDEQGVVRLCDTSITSGSHEGVLAIVNYQQEAMRLAQRALESYPREQRDVATVTLGISQETFVQIREMLAEMRQRIMALADADADADRVYQLNMQLFPLSKLPQSKQEQS
jgi:uncharacterized protein (TIGR02147 family)